MLTIEELKEIASRGFHLQAEHIERLKQTADELGIEHPKNKRCKMCWSDFAVVLAKALRDKEAGEGVAETSKARRYRLRDENVDVLIHGVRVNSETLTDELGDWLTEHGFPKHLLIRIEDADTAE